MLSVISNLLVSSLLCFFFFLSLLATLVSFFLCKTYQFFLCKTYQACVDYPPFFSLHDHNHPRRIWSLLSSMHTTEQHCICILLYLYHVDVIYLFWLSTISFFESHSYQCRQPTVQECLWNSKLGFTRHIVRFRISCHGSIQSFLQ